LTAIHEEGEMTSQQTPDRDGTLTDVDGRDAVRFERRLGHPPERVWKALTDPDDLRAWFPADIEGDLTSPGAELSFPFRDREAETMGGEVLESDPPARLAFTWGEQILRFELKPDGDGTRLVFTHALPRAETAKTAAGWQLRLVLLEARLAGEPEPGFDQAQWIELHEGYADQFGVDPEEGRRALRERERAMAAARERSSRE
jgi:uncharacterized protein YndB with AHSA1/START domain